ncbi:hypothetical protein PR048_012313 [Dryococelus australis]|uniref:Uncharacterized protein n=1 Tax=Dryococelus australis TaxID=614101 RepID=A0ABQ9HPM9_9NEOP|nr:hypothetical protein PR048_012313 [Dryococelus australis]
MVYEMHELLKMAFGEREIRKSQPYEHINKLCDALGLSFGTCRQILTEQLGLCHSATKSVPLLIHNQK